MRVAALVIATWLGSALVAAIVLIVGAAASGKTVQEGALALFGMAIAYLAIAGSAIANTARITRGASRQGRMLMILALIAGEVAVLATCSLGALVALNR